MKVIDEAMGLLGESLLLAHAKDIDASGHVVAPGEGKVDLVAFTTSLRRVGYNGALDCTWIRGREGWPGSESFAEDYRGVPR